MSQPLQKIRTDIGCQAQERLKKYYEGINALLMYTRRHGEAEIEEASEQEKVLMEIIAAALSSDELKFDEEKIIDRLTGFVPEVVIGLIESMGFSNPSPIDGVKEFVRFAAGFANSHIDRQLSVLRQQILAEQIVERTKNSTSEKAKLDALLQLERANYEVQKCLPGTFWGHLSEAVAILHLTRKKLEDSGIDIEIVAGSALPSGLMNMFKQNYILRRDLAKAKKDFEAAKDWDEIVALITQYSDPFSPHDWKTLISTLEMDAETIQKMVQAIPFLDDDFETQSDESTD